MNTGHVVSAVAAEDLSGKEFALVKLTSTGVAVAGASDKIIGTVIRGAAAGHAVAVFLVKNGLQFVTVGNNTAIAVGEELEQAANGTVVKKTTGTAVGVAWEAAPANANTGKIRAILY
jgi:predicted RecA/RadA family phage recombinase